jgi:hypothetical protein
MPSTAEVVVGNGRMSKIFSATVTDESWKNMQDTLSSTNLGILIPRAVVNNVQASTDSTGAMAWRIQNAQTLLVSRRGWGAKKGYDCYESAAIPAHSINPDEIIQYYVMPADATANQSNALAWVHTTKGTELYQAKDIADNTATAMTTSLQGQTLGDAAFNSTLTGFSIQAEEGAKVVKVEFIDSAGGVQLTIRGNHRMPTAGGTSAYYNLEAKGLSLPITKGFSMKITTVTA